MTPIRYPQGGMPPQGGKGQPQVKPGVPMPAQGGKGGVQQPMPPQGGKGLSRTLPPPGQGSTMPPQGGKGQNFGPNVFPAPQVQQPQVPAQGGKMSPLIQQVLNNQQQAQIQQPQVQQPLVQQRDPQVQQPFSGFPRPMLPPGVQMPVGLPAQPQVLPMKPMPANMAPQQVGLGQAMQGLSAPQGLAQLQQMLAGKQ